MDINTIIGVIIIAGALVYSIYFLVRKFINIAKGNNCDSCDGCPYSSKCKSNDFKKEDKK